MAGLKRNTQPGGTCKVLAKGDKRRLADVRNALKARHDAIGAWRKMDAFQREEFVGFLLENGLKDVVHFQSTIIASFVEVAK